MAVVSVNSKKVKILPKYLGLLVFRASKRIWWVKYIWHKSIISTHFILSWRENFVNLSKNSEGNKEPFRVSVLWKFLRSHIKSFCWYPHQTGNCWDFSTTVFYWPWPLLPPSISKIKRGPQKKYIFNERWSQFCNFWVFHWKISRFFPGAFFH